MRRLRGAGSCARVQRRCVAGDEVTHHTRGDGLGAAAAGLGRGRGGGGGGERQSGGGVLLVFHKVLVEVL